MNNAPERITAWVNKDGTTQFEGGNLFPHGVEADYIRADLAAYKPTPHETQSKASRVHIAELLIAQLPDSHDGRNTWLMNYGKSDEAKAMRATRGLAWIRETEAAETRT